MIEALGQTCHLDIQDFLTGIMHLLFLGDKRMGIDCALQSEVAHGYRLADDHLRIGATLGIDKGGVLPALDTEFLHIDLHAADLRLEREAVALYEQLAILEDQCIAAIDDILRRLTETSTRIDVAADGARTLLSQERLQVGMLAQQFVAGREVEDDVGTSHCQIVAWRDGSPYILADLHAKLHAVGSDEDLGICTDRHRATCKVDLRRIQILRRGKPALLIELRIVWQIGLGHDAQQRTPLNDGGTVI